MERSSRGLPLSGRSCSRRTSFVDDGEWHAYQLRVQVALRPEEPLPAVGDPRRRSEWQSLSKAHKKMVAQLNADGATPIVAISSAAAESEGPAGRRATPPNI